MQTACPLKSSYSASNAGTRRSRVRPHSTGILSPSFLKAMALFCKTSIGSIHALGLRARLPQAQTTLLLRAGADSDRCSRLRDKRTGYAFCSACIAEQTDVHIRWEWVFPALLRCHIHKSALRHGCLLCGEDDPLPFGAAPAAARAVLCRSCGANLTDALPVRYLRPVDAADVFIETIYRAALRGASPRAALLDETTATQLCRFVDDILQLLAWYPSPELSPRLTDSQNQYLPFRVEILAIVGALVRNAAPDSDPSGRQTKYREGIKLWLGVLSLLSGREEELIEIASEHWPTGLRRRLHAPLDHHERGDGRRSPFRSTLFRPGLKYINRFQLRDLSAANQLERRNSGI